MAQPNAEDVNPLHVQWKNPEYLAFLSAQKGLAGVSQSVLDTSNVMDYFSSSPFYDRRSNNEHVRMQSAALMAEIMATQPQSSEEVLKKMARRHEEELNRRFTGLEFALVHARPPGCFVIHKRWRRGPDRVDPPLAAYYVINDCVYQAPDMYTILSTRLVGTPVQLTKAILFTRPAYYTWLAS
ncbi:med6-domain-containing protein [Malassezia pachydermatis]|uniref:Mediator of RNA polymerase II transcription subunit 6 n=1 Tax=Malassezia pachydermatis TaxID=77020 RepID=A0A0N0RS01_9BASI|nr:med6-domain-containing protein [Malassezia pachydermatis]KOS13103.1 med6-domain-containing protein [Malassezia pachydermatis]